ncbi:MAG: hypothetical protein JRJ14_03245, partial [Deltaproteobacteria bacterium]|nr:hypothetical protein [Deltaproteobacteria bacterium]
LLGIPFPRLTFERLKLLYSSGVENLAHQGGTQPPDLVPYNINHEIVRLFLFNPDMDIEKEIKRLALNWTGEKYHRILIKTWRFAEKAILAFPNVSALYSTYGFTWYRLWVRPFVPNMESVLPKDRTFYEDHMCTTPHNPNNVDLSRDVLFHLTFPKQAGLVMKRIDKNVWEPLDRAISFLEGAISGEKITPGSGDIIHDQLIRLSALRCWFMTQRNVAAWISGVYGYQEARNKTEKDKYRSMITDLIEKEIINTKRLKVLLESGVEFMAMTDLKETPLIHGNNLSNNLNKRVKIMRAHIDDEPYINPDYIEEKAKKRYDQTGSK